MDGRRRLQPAVPLAALAIPLLLAIALEDVPGGPVFLPPELYVKEYGARESAP